MSNDGEQLIKNVTREALADAIRKDEGPAPEKKAPLGCVERVLDMRNKNAVIGACTLYCQKDGHKGLIDQTRLNRLKKLFNWDETLEYFAMIDDSLDDEVRAWKQAKNQYKLWKDYRAGLVKAEEVKKIYPSFDLEGEIQKPALVEPKNKLEHRRGPEAAVYIPSKLDAWIQDALKATDWLVHMDELAVEVCEKFGIKSEE